MLRHQKQLFSLLRRGSAARFAPSTLTPLHRRLLSTSAASAPFSAEEYLVSTCGLTRAQAHKSSKSLPHLKSPTKPDAVLAFLSGLGLSHPDIVAVVAADPLLLCANVDKTLAPRVAALRGLGLSAPEIARLMLVGSSALRGRDVASRFEFWIRLIGSFSKLLLIMKKCRGLLNRDLDKVVKPNIGYLLRCGVKAHDVAMVGYGGMWVLLSNQESLKALLMRADELGVPRSAAAFKYALILVRAASPEKISSRREMLKRALGCSEDQLRIAVARHPLILGHSEDNLHSTAEFLITKVGLDPGYIVRRPTLLSYSLKARLVPRFLVMKALQEKVLPRPDFYTLAAATEKCFVSKYIDTHKDSVAGLADMYAAARAGDMSSEFQL